jgi:hypothetical protein
LYVATATDTWTLYYTPYTYPHPLAGGEAPPEEPAGSTARAGSGRVDGDVIVTGN